MKTYKFAVFVNKYKGRDAWSAYSRDYSIEWSGYQGVFTVTALTHKAGVAKAIAMAKEARAKEVSNG